MAIHDTIRMLRVAKGWSLEEMAEKIPMSKSGYIKIEQGETALMSDKLLKISQILGIEIVDLIRLNEKGVICLISDNSQFSSNYYDSSSATILENEKLKLTIKHQQELLEQQKREIERLDNLLKLFQTDNNDSNNISYIKLPTQINNQ